jgi:multidrug efflux pump subunit AcrA (membrane-fusion protein)
MLNIFNQKLVMSNRQILEIEDSTFPKKFKPILNRLNQATQDTLVRETMTYEDMLANELFYLRDMAKEEAMVEARVEARLEYKKEFEQAQQQAEQAQQQAEQAQQQAEQAQQQIRINAILQAQKYVSQGTPKSVVASINNISETELEEWLQMTF